MAKASQLDASQVTMKWAANTKAAQKAYVDGINAVEVSPTELAAQKVDKYLQGVQDAAQSGKYANGLRSVSLNEWKTQAVQKGAGRIAAGVTAATPKMQAVMADLLPKIAQVQQVVRAMPDTTLEERLARMNENARRMSQIKVNKRPGM